MEASGACNSEPAAAVLTVPISSKCSMEPEMAQAKPNACSMSHLNAAVPEAVQTDAYPMRNSNAAAGVADYRILDAERVS